MANCVPRLAVLLVFIGACSWGLEEAMSHEIIPLNDAFIDVTNDPAAAAAENAEETAKQNEAKASQAEAELSSKQASAESAARNAKTAEDDAKHQLERVERTAQ